MRLNENTMRVLRRWAQWELGDSTWADNIAEVIEDPEVADAYLDEQGADDD